MKSQKDVRNALLRAWPAIVRECRQVLGSEQHYQAVVYYCLRTTGRVPVKQLGMNVKIGIYKPKTAYWRKRARGRHEDYRGHCEPIPDVAIFAPGVGGDWRRRRFDETLKLLIGAVEIKASERDKNRLQKGEIIQDIEKVAAHKHEKIHRHKVGFYAAVMVIDTAPETIEQMTPRGRDKVARSAKQNGVDFFYVSNSASLSPASR
jgi:hypothetical protein